ncbi:MAG: hypothetical protein IBX39_06885 [Candidatus Methanoperedenaceae archaeon]|nr:hypothetical protein [Candidatus Methanoperedenaceae archaeon]MDW7726241.1 hypothetical protein [Candidatus Methanoperedens sp.]
MTFKKTVAAKVIRSEIVHILRVLDVQLFQYLESDTKRPMEREITRDTAAITPPCEMISIGSGVLTFDIAVTMLIFVYNISKRLIPFS